MQLIIHENFTFFQKNFVELKIFEVDQVVFISFYIQFKRFYSYFQHFCNSSIHNSQKKFKMMKLKNS
jgi:hypothetical protein